MTLSLADHIKGKHSIGSTFYLIVHHVNQKVRIAIYGRNDKIILQCMILYNVLMHVKSINTL